ncbi:MAG: hypothetical protein ACT4OP_13330 [Actinomycetota bacterium]
MIVFVHINKTGGSTLRYLLRSSFGWRHCDVEPWHGRWVDPPFSAEDLRRVRRLYPHLESIAGHRVTGYVDLARPATETLYVTVLRDPIRACASRFQYNVDYRGKKHLVFDEWIKKDWVRDYQTKRIAGVADLAEAVKVIEKRGMFVGLTERFDESMVMFRGLRAPNLDISYRRVNVAADNTLTRSLLTDHRTRALIVDANKVDQQLYDYVVEKLYPNYQRDYGPALSEEVKKFQSNRGDFNDLNITLSRVKQISLQQPLLYLYRRQATQPIVERLLS